MARLRILIVVMAGSLVVTGTVPASTIVGTARNDTLRGTAKSDKLYGRAGNDTLFGLGGNDLLVGGVGADRLVCGPGRDVARADAKDKVAKDCEIVKGLVTPPPQPPPTTSGVYCGPTSQGMPICFEVVGSGMAEQIVSTIRLTVQTTCEPAAQLDRSFEIRLRAPVRSDGTFTAPSIVPGLFSATIEGEFDPTGTSAAGSLTLLFVEERSGVRYECNSGVVSWTAKTPPPDVAAQPGTFCGFTDQGNGLCFDVAGTPKTVTNLELLVKTECEPAASFGVSSTIPTTYAIREDGTFTVRRSGSGTTQGGGSFTVSHTMTGTFDASGTTATGTLAAHVAYDAPDGTHYECDSGTFGWSTRRQ